jgi:glyoxylate/hydroxypyruvate reductase
VQIDLNRLACNNFKTHKNLSLLLVAQNRDLKPFRNKILEIDPNIDAEIWPAVASPERVQFAVAWNHPRRVFQQYPNLKAVSSLGAGVDHLIRDDSIPEHVRLARVVVPSLEEQMCDYVLTSALNLIRNTHTYYTQQQRGEWKTQPAHSKDEISMGIMGLGELGAAVAKRMQMNGFRVCGWSRSKKEILGIETFSQNQLDDFLGETNILVCLLPLTSQTDGILDLDLFKKLRKPAFLINAARGEHLVEEDLIYSLDTGQLTHAVLDVFSNEPLPESHPFWGRKKITITPHIASVTDPKEAAGLIVENYKRLLSGMDLLHEVNRERGY